MMIFVTSAISALLLAVVCYGAFKNASVSGGPVDRVPSILLGTTALSLIVGCIIGDMSADMLMVEIMPSLAGMSLLVSSLWERDRVSPFVPVFVTLSVLPLPLHILTAIGWLDSPPSPVLLTIFSIYLLLFVSLFIIGLVRRLRNVKVILKTGTLWTNVGIAVDAVYMVLLMMVSFGYVAVSAVARGIPEGWLAIFPLFCGGMLAALGVRKADDVMFVFWRKQERRIVESMKVNKVEAASDPSTIDDVYREIYERVVTYFDAEKPFLDNELTINDLVKVLYSNKLYISRAISQFTGRNFCQFVNYYRVLYSMELFRANPDLKIHELAVGCGFNTDVSYNMAFRLFMGETPGEWCRKERSRRLKMKK